MLLQQLSVPVFFKNIVEVPVLFFEVRFKFKVRNFTVAAKFVPNYACVVPEIGLIKIKDVRCWHSLHSGLPVLDELRHLLLGQAGPGPLDVVCLPKRELRMPTNEAIDEAGGGEIVDKPLGGDPLPIQVVLHQPAQVCAVEGESPVAAHLDGIHNTLLLLSSQRRSPAIHTAMSLVHPEVVFNHSSTGTSTAVKKSIGS